MEDWATRTGAEWMVLRMRHPGGPSHDETLEAIRRFGDGGDRDVHVAGSVGLVTGGASGLGAGVARMLVEGGGKAVILDRAESDGAAFATELGPCAAFVPCDVTDSDSVTSAVDAAAAAFGRIDLLLSSAGICPAARVVDRTARRSRSRCSAGASTSTSSGCSTCSD